jgi:hypothetical protein
MGLIVDALNRAARHVSLTAPSSWLTATADEYAELRDDFLRETVDDLQDRIDWPAPIGSQTTITGTGVETYTLPADFKRLMRNPYSVYDEQLDTPGVPVNSDGEWVELQDNGTAGAVRYYRITGYEGNWSIRFLDEPTTNIILSYVSRNWMATAGGAAGYMFTSATDVLLFPDRLIETGIVWRWRERKGLPFSDKYNEHEMLLARYLNDARGIREINFGPKRLVRWQDRVPAFIPAS